MWPMTALAQRDADGALGVLALVCLVWLAFMFATVWRIFTKAGRPGWAALIPIYNSVVLLHIAGRPWWWLCLMFIPLVNIVMFIIWLNDLAASFGRGSGFTVGLLFLPFIFYPILAFGGSRYLGPGGLPPTLGQDWGGGPSGGVGPFGPPPSGSPAPAWGGNPPGSGVAYANPPAPADALEPRSVVGAGSGRPPSGVPPR